MEKRKYELGKYADMHEEKEIAGKDGTKVTVRDHIPYAEKEAMGNEMAENMVMVHDDSCTYLSSQENKYELYLIAKYYTDIDTDDVDIDDIANFMINNGLAQAISDYIMDDLDEVRSIYCSLESAVRKTFDDDHSLTKAIRTSFGFLFTGEDITESLAKAEAMKDTVYEAINAFRKVEKEKEENIDHGKLTVGGNVLNFAKKKE